MGEKRMRYSNMLDRLEREYPEFFVYIYMGNDFFADDKFVLYKLKDNKNVKVAELTTQWTQSPEEIYHYLAQLCENNRREEEEKLLSALKEPASHKCSSCGAALKIGNSYCEYCGTGC
jgi:hypothetical protein